MADEQRIVPILQYEDVAGAVDWLVKVFGFRERLRDRMATDDGRVWHSAVELGDAHVMLSTVPGYENPKRHGRVFGGLYVIVDDVEAHHRCARAAGAVILSEPADQFWGDRTYGAEDPEGHHWYFGQHVRDVTEYAPSSEDVGRHVR